MSQFDELLREWSPVLARLAGLLIVVLIAPLVGLAAWKKIYPHTPLVVALAVPSLLTIALLFEPRLLIPVLLMDAAVFGVSLADLFRLTGRYRYRGGTNPIAMIALVVAVLPVIPGFLRAATTPGGVVPNPTLFDHLYTYAWFVTFFLSGLIYLALMKRS